MAKKPTELSIPVQNIYYLLSYAWDYINEAETIGVGTENYNGLLDLFAKVLNQGTTRLLSRGLDRDYVVIQEDIRGIKGKLNFEPTLKRFLLHNGKTNCSFDELSYDIPQNQILKATMRNLTWVESVSTEHKQQCARLYKKFVGVSDVSLSSNLFRSVRIHRNNRFYRFLIDICRFIFEHQLMNENKGPVTFWDFEEDQMGKLFETFVKKFSEHHTSCEVSSPHIDWLEKNEHETDNPHLPIMKTDIVLTSPEHTIIIDTKFYQKPLAEPRHRDSDSKVRSENLYQIYAYAMNWVEDHAVADHQQETWLLYAAVDEVFDYRFQLSDKQFRVCSIDLSQNWKIIEKNLIELLNNRAENKR
ncbi:MAG: hypothetical protein OXF84_05155 [Bacteroidetes bacterium]|nr:hypothetical protein [Bacteroidota bacterium]